MRVSTLLAHLKLTDEALRNERFRIANHQEFIGKLRLEGSNLSTARDLLQSMNANLSSLLRHRERLIEQLGLLGQPPSPPHLDGDTRSG